MKVVSKILNILVGLFFVIGVYATVVYFVKVKPQNEDYKIQVEKNVLLDKQIVANKEKIDGLIFEIRTKDEIIDERNNRITDLVDDLEKVQRERDEAIKKLNNLSLEEVISYITAYYGVEETEIEIIQYDNEIKIAFKESLVRNVATTISKLESRNMELSVYKKEVSEYELLVSDYRCKINLLEQKDSLRTENFNAEKQKNSGLEKIIDNRNKKIKSLTTQRTTIAGIAIVVIVLILI